MVGMPQSLFRRSAVRAVEQRWFSTVLVVTPPSTTPTVIMALLATACLFLATVVIEVPERIRVPGVLLPDGGLLKVRARRAGWVNQLSVTNGSTVEQGQVLLWITDEQHAPMREPELAERVESLRSELQMFEQSVEQEIAAIESKQRHNNQRLRLTERRLTAARDEHETRLQQAELQDNKASRLEQLVADGLFARQNADDVAANALQTRALVQTVWQRVLSIQDELMVLQQQADADLEATDMLRTKAGIRREGIIRQIAASELQSTVELTSPGDGVVAGLSVRSGSLVLPGQIIMTLHDPNDRLEARLYVSADNAAMIRPGQHVELQLRAYPHEIYGTQSAVVTSVSAVALLPDEIGDLIPMLGPVFEIRATLHETSINARGEVWQLPPGTVFSADLVRRRWPLYRWLLRSEPDRPNA